MLTVEEYRSGFLSYLESFKSPTNPKNLYEPVSYILGLKGKRIRPILTLLTCDIFNDNHKSSLQKGGYVIAMLTSINDNGMMSYEKSSITSINENQP